MSLWLNKREKEHLQRLLEDDYANDCYDSVKELYHCEKHLHDCETCGFYKMRDKLFEKIKAVKV